jgi:YnbE-like lipoprotein
MTRHSPLLLKLNKPFSMVKAKGAHMHDQLTKSRNGAIQAKMKKGTILLLPTAVLISSGCVQVTAPDKPIVIELNIAIRSEVLVKLDQASKKAIDDNPDIF